IDPLRFACEACRLRDSKYLDGRIFVAALSPDRLALGTLNRETAFGKSNCLPPLRADMHLNTARLLVVPRQMLKLIQDKVRTHLAIHAGKQVHVEGCGYAERVVIRLD